MRPTLMFTALALVACSSDKGVTIHNSAPSVSLYEPFDGSEVDAGEAINFVAQIGDDRDEAPSLIRIWSSDVQGPFSDTSVVDATGYTVWTTGALDIGEHVISLQVIDSAGLTSADNLMIRIVEPSDTGAPEDTGPAIGEDADGDGYTANVDCDDDDALVNPGAEDHPYDGIDQDCDGTDLTDADGDGFDAGVVGGDDCDDTDPLSYPDGTEVCDGEDNDCDGTVDEEDATGCSMWFLDADDDGYGGEDEKCLCGPSGDYTSETETDCDDDDESVNPGATSFSSLATSSGGFDWDCNGVEERQWLDVGSCDGTVVCDLVEGWDGGVPACGESAMWVTGCSGLTCDESGIARTQSCR